MNEKNKKSSISSLAPLLLFVIFTTCVLSVLLTGADVYQKFSTRDKASYDRRTTVQYLTTRFRQSDSIDGYFVGEFDGSSPRSEGDTFFFCEVFSGRTFYTRIYCHEGYLYELFSEKEAIFSPEDGEKILALENLHFSSDGSLLTIDVEYPSGETDQIKLYTRCREEAVYEE